MAHKHWSGISVMSGATRETGLTGGTRASVTPENSFQRRRHI